MQKRICSLLFAAFLLLNCLILAAGAFADGGDPATGWDGTAVAEPKLGSGSSSNPYQIATAENLAWVSQQAKTDKFEGKSFILTDDIDLGGNEWTPIGTGTEFYATFDGDFHTVSNFKVTDTALSAAGLFGTVRSATIRNLTVSNATVSGTSGSQGAILGVSNRGTLIRCATTDSVSVSGVFAGGIVGSLNGDCTVTACVNNAAVSANGSNVRVGGIAGLVNGASVFSLCVNNGALSGTGSNAMAVRVGGLMGQSAAVTVSECVNNGAVEAYGYAGGLSGHCNVEGGSFTSCASRATVNSTYYPSVCGALTGFLNAETAFNTCYYTAEAGSAAIGSSSSASATAESVIILANDEEVAGKDTTTLADMSALLSAINAKMGPATAPRQKPSAPSEWENGEIATAFAGGTGDYNDPYRIATAGQLAYLAESVNGGESYRDRFFALENDIDLGGKYWSPIGVEAARSFRGVFNGWGFTVSNFTVSLTDDDATVCGGLFGSVNEGIVKNVKIDLAEIEVHGVKSNVGGVVGLAASTQIIACEAGANVLVSYIGAEESKEVVAGGIVGRCEACTVQYCTNRAQVYSFKASPAAYAGGIAALGSNSTISYCANYGKITVASDVGGRYDCGGIVGTLGVQSGAAGKIDHCVNYGTIISGQHGGGLVAYVQTAFCEITDSYSCGAVSANHQWSGLLLGRWDLNFTTMDRCGYLKQVDPEPSKTGHMRWVVKPIAVLENNAGSGGNILGTFTEQDETEFEASAAPILSAIAENVSASVAAAETEIQPHEDDDGPQKEETTTLNRDIPTKKPSAESDTTAPVEDPTATTGSEPSQKGGCSSVIGGGLAVLLAVIPAAALIRRKKD